MKKSIILLLFIICSSSFSQNSGNNVTWKASVTNKIVKAGDNFIVKVIASIEDGWHMYSTTTPKEGAQPTVFRIVNSKEFIISGKIKQSKFISKFEELMGANTEFYEGNAEFLIPISVEKNVSKGKKSFSIEVEYMSCNNKVCMPPSTEIMKINIDVLSDIVSDQKVDTTIQITNITTDTTKKILVNSNPEQTIPQNSQLEKAKSEGLWSFIGFAMMMGALALLTPCVFPMIPITVSFFTKREQKTKKQGVRDAFIYSAGIIFTFVTIGLLLAVLLGASGVSQFATNPWVNMIIGFIFVIFALNLFGLFEIAIPSSILTKLDNKSSSGSGIISILLMGLTFSLTTFTCTVPFIGSILVAASKGEFIWPIIGMFAYSFVFALPFFFLALFPMLIKSMPKSGAWMNSIKVVMGLVVLAASMKFFSNSDQVFGLGLLNYNFFLSIWIAICIITTLYLLGKFRLSHDSPIESIGVLRMFFAIMFLSSAIYLSTGFLGNSLGELDAFFPPRDLSNKSYFSSSQMKDGELKWLKNVDEAIELAKKENKKIFLQFTGYTCTNCKWMKTNMFTKQEIKDLLSKFVLLELYTDGQGEEYTKNKKLQETRFGTIAIPFYVILDKENKIISTFPGLTRDKEEFKLFLEKGLK